MSSTEGIELDFDVTIVGFGPTGAALANLLGQDGIRTLVLERAPEIYTLPRAVHFDHEVMRIFQTMGLADKILPHTGSVAGYEFKNGEGKVLIQIELENAITSQGWRPDYMFHQPSLERVLRDGAANHESVEVHLGTEFVGLSEDDEGVTVRVANASNREHSTFTTRYVVGCDGASSPTREAAGLAIEDLDFDEPWLVVDATVDRPVSELDFPQMPLQLCDPKRPTTVIPVVGPHIRWEFMLLPGEGVEMQEPERVHALVAKWIDPDQVEIIRSAVYRFHALVGSQWRTRGVMIAGDAAHQMPPFLGQGMCAGIRDAANLAWKLRLVVQGLAGDALLDTYQEERAPHVRKVIDTAVSVGHIICTQDEEVARTRDAQLASGAGFPQNAGANSKSQMGPPLPAFASGLLEPAPRHEISGELSLQGRVRDREGREGLFDDLVGPGFVLLWSGEAQDLDASARARVEGLGIHEVSFAKEGRPRCKKFDDVTGSYEEWFEKTSTVAMLIRPDHTIFGVATRSRSVADLLQDLESALH